jgi:hypothetical protein
MRLDIRMSVRACRQPRQDKTRMRVGRGVISSCTLMGGDVPPSLSGLEYSDTCNR